MGIWQKGYAKEFGRHLKDTRVLAGLTSGELAYMTGISRRDIEDLERTGDYDPTIQEVSDLADALGVGFSFLVWCGSLRPSIPERMEAVEEAKRERALAKKKTKTSAEPSPRLGEILA